MIDITVVDHLLTTTRSVRKRLDLGRPVEREIIEQCIEIAVQAPTGGNAQGWGFVVVTDPQKKAVIGEYYKQSWYRYSAARATENLTDQMQRVISSAQYLADHMGEVPVMIISCYRGRVENAPVVTQAGFYGSILPATWSLMLALRARGLGSAWTTLHLSYEKEVASLLGIPDNVTQAALLPVAYYTGDDFKPAERRPAKEFTFWDGWGQR